MSEAGEQGALFGFHHAGRAWTAYALHREDDAVVVPGAWGDAPLPARMARLFAKALQTPVATVCSVATARAWLDSLRAVGSAAAGTLVAPGCVAGVVVDGTRLRDALDGLPPDSLVRFARCDDGAGMVALVATLDALGGTRYLLGPLFGSDARGLPVLDAVAPGTWARGSND